MSECSQERRLQWASNLERMEGSVWSSKCRTLNVSISFFRGRPRRARQKLIFAVNLAEMLKEAIIHFFLIHFSNICTL